MITESFLQSEFGSWYGRYEMVAPNIRFDLNSGECDLLAIRQSGYCDEIEIKINPIDYRRDFKKRVILKGHHVSILKHDALRNGQLPWNYFSFLMPEDMVSKCVIPEYAGLYVHIKTRYSTMIKEVKRAKLLHKNKISMDDKYSIGRKMSYKYWNHITNNK